MHLPLSYHQNSWDYLANYSPKIEEPYEFLLVINSDMMERHKCVCFWEGCAPEKELAGRSRGCLPEKDVKIVKYYI